MKSKIVLFLTIVFTFLLQCTVMDFISIGSITPNLILILCVSMGLMRGRKSGLWVGFFSGLLVDMFYGSVFGFYALIYMYVGFISGYAHSIYYDNDVKIPMILAAGGDLLYNLAVYGHSVPFKRTSWTGNVYLPYHHTRGFLHCISYLLCVQSLLLY